MDDGKCIGKNFSKALSSIFFFQSSSHLTNLAGFFKSAKPVSITEARLLQFETEYKTNGLTFFLTHYNVIHTQSQFGGVILEEVHRTETCTQRPLKAGGHCRTMPLLAKQPCQYRLQGHLSATATA